MRNLPDTVWRAKGFVRFTDSDEQWMFQYVTGEFDMEWLRFITRTTRTRCFYRQGF